MLISPPIPGVASELTRLEALGLTPTYRRQHPGQGTQNLCFYFDNLCIELLWVCNQDEVRSKRIAQTRLYERSEWRVADANPFGNAWRGLADEREWPIPVWNY